ncbi:MAG: UbiA family prenyltransferase [Bacteroidia bacterium]|nr:UbiA family prenyltransferase [Bacteroidia bacterium]
MGSSSAHWHLSARVSPLRRVLRHAEALGRLARPVNLLLITATSLSAQLLLWSKTERYYPPWTEWSWMLLSTLLIAAGGYWLNDLYDQLIDRINRPTRAMWVARAGQRFLLTATSAAWLLGVIIALNLPLRILILHIGAILVLAWYARFGKRTGLLGNAAVATLTGMVPWEVILLSERTTYATAWMVPLAIGFNFVRELVKDAEDLPGDQTYGVRSLPGRISTSAWSRLLYALWIALIGLALMPAGLYYVVWDKLPIPFITAILPTTILPLLWGLSEWGDYRFMSLTLKFAMVGGLIALWTF